MKKCVIKSDVVIRYCFPLYAPAPGHQAITGGTGLSKRGNQRHRFCVAGGVVFAIPNRWKRTSAVKIYRREF